MEEDLNNSTHQKQDYDRTIKYSLRTNGIFILILIGILFLITYPPLTITDKGINLWYNWVSIGLTIFVSWIFSKKTFESNLIEAQKERALIAIRRPFEISRSITRIIQNINRKRKEIRNLEVSDNTSVKLIITEYLNGIELQAIELKGHNNQVIADWQGFLGKDIEDVNEITERIVLIIEKRDIEIEEMNNLHEEALKQARAKGDEEVKRVTSEFEKKLKEKEIDFKRKLNDEYEKGKKESALFRSMTSGSNIGTVVSPLQPSLLNFGSLMNSNQSLFSLNNLAAAATMTKCPNCGSYDTTIKLGISGRFCNVCRTSFKD